MFALTRHETKQIMAGQAGGVARIYDVCPHEIGMQMHMTSKFLDQSGRSIPFVKVQIVSLRPGTCGQFRKDQQQAKTDGYENAAMWHGQMNVMYQGIKDSAKMTHIKFRVLELDREAGRRPNIKKAQKEDTF